MARKAQIERLNKQLRMIQVQKDRRLALKAVMKNPQLPWEERERARVALSKLPKNSHPNHARLRCLLPGRSRGNFRKFGICRIKLRELAHRGEIPGMMKASW